MRKIKKISKRKFACFMVILLLASALSSVPRAKAYNPYASPWGVLYRKPEGQNKYGCWWWQKLGKEQGGNIAIDSYYTYGSACSVEHIYKDSKGKAKRVKETGSSVYGDSDAECMAGGAWKGKSTTFHAGAYGINFNKVVKY